MIRANEESNAKSKRVGDAWKNKRNNAATKKLTTLCPNWMYLSEDRTQFILRQDHVHTVKMIFQMAIGGKGVRVITKELNQQNVTTYGRSNEWAESTVKKILHSRAVLGEYQPHKIVDGKRIPDGEPVLDYYPKIIDTSTYHLAQSAMRSRQQNAAGRKGENVSNVFSGLLKCAYCGATMRYLNKGEKPKGGKYLTCVNTQNGMGCIGKFVRYDEFEKSFLTFVRDVDLRSLAGGVRQVDELETLRRNVIALSEAVTADEAKIHRYFDQMENSPSLSDIMIERANALGETVKATKETIGGIEEKIATLTENGIEISDEDLSGLISIFQDGSGDRFALADRIRSLVSRVRIFSVGKQDDGKAAALIKNSDLPNREKSKIMMVIENQRKAGMASYPHFEITFKTGDIQVVIPDPSDAGRILVSTRAGNDRFIEYPEQLHNPFAEIDDELISDE